MRNPTPHWLTCGFRPFFFLGALAMAFGVLLWLPMLTGHLAIPTAFAPRDWHIHTMLFGAMFAIIGGFSLTAVSNWTGRPPVQGRELLFLVVVWVLGRGATATSGMIGGLPAALVDLAFPAALVWIFAREVIRGGSSHNYMIVATVALLGLTDAAFHFEALELGYALYSTHAAISIILMLVILIGGRLVPNFSRNWLRARGASSLPPAFNRFDAVTTGVSLLALIAWTAVPEAIPTAIALLVAGSFNFVRVARWQGWRTISEPLLAVLHIGYATVPLGFVLLGFALLVPSTLDPVAALHCWLVGTFGTMTLGVMTRAARGHTGRRLVADRRDVAIYVLALLGAAARIAAPFADGGFHTALDIAGGLWIAAFLGYAACYAPLLLGKPANG